MALTTSQQILEQIKSASNILITCPKSWNTDTVAASLALSKTIKLLEKNSLIVCDKFQPNKKIIFLESIENIKTTIGNLRKLIISLNTKNTKVDKIDYQKENDKLNIVITPKQGGFNLNDIATKYSDFNFDLIITLGVSDLESLGSIYNNNTDFFYQKPIINIDNQPHNENYGQINLVNLKATSISEIIFELLSFWNQNLINDDIATQLLTGVYSGTHSFRSTKLTPTTLNIASQLINHGADRKKIVYNLYQKKNLGTLKLWGMVLACLEQSDNQKIIWSKLTHTDFAKSNTTEKDLDGVIEELISATPNAQIIILLYETTDNKTGVIAHTEESINALKLFSKYEPFGTPTQIEFILENKNLDTAEQELIAHTQTQLNNT